MARMIRERVRSSPIRHSHTRRTLQPSLRSLRATLASRRRFDTIFDFQNFLLLLDGRSQRGHPCQKHPSTNSATLDFGHAKSGFPATGHCFLNPRMPRLRSNFSMLRSVVPPNVRTEAIIFDRTSLDTLSIAIIGSRMSANPRLGLNLLGRVDSVAPPRFSRRRL
jgi:hypothetical protein